MFGLGTQELVIVFLIIFVLFGATKLPQIGKGMGEAIRNFKKGISGIKDEVSAVITTGDEKINRGV
ncbi:MAG: twin-arginine translocase TatA/TatE family subunit [Nitrospirae bacterium]|nr:twin-arginine translocase TatA/TatE family subunit [Nitrospirota bacterium]